MTDDIRKFVQRRVPNIPQSGMMTYQQTADYIGCSLSKLHKMIHAGIGPPKSDVGGMPRFDIDAVAKWVKKDNAA
jgi:excisionase family DNA binding protein